MARSSDSLTTDPAFSLSRDLYGCMAATSERAHPPQATAGSDASFEAWYGYEHARLIATLVLITGDLDLATEGVDEGFARALERWDRVHAMTSPVGWVYTVALNHARRLSRRRAVERRVLVGRTREHHVPAPANEIWLLVAGLPRRQREVVVLRHVADLREAEIADVLGISRSTVSSTLADAHARLGHLLDEPVSTKEDHPDV